MWNDDAVTRQHDSVIDEVRIRRWEGDSALSAQNGLEHGWAVRCVAFLSLSLHREWEDRGEDGYSTANATSNASRNIRRRDLGYARERYHDLRLRSMSTAAVTPGCWYCRNEGALRIRPGTRSRYCDPACSVSTGAHQCRSRNRRVPSDEMLASGRKFGKSKRRARLGTSSRYPYLVAPAL
jgi:hypothetical protein